jgi:hypothetical protein
MKILITESQYSLLRRLDLFIPVVQEVMLYEDPCEYSRFEQYKRIVIRSSLGIMMNREKLSYYFPTTRSFNEFRENTLPPFLHDQIKEYYDSFEGKC